MKNNVANWIDQVLSGDVPYTVVAFCFNLYEEADSSWAMELVGTDCFDIENEDWACSEVTDFGSRNCMYTWKKKCKWDKALKYMAKELNRYLKRGKYADLLKSKIGIGVGFVDGNIEILYKK